MAVMSDLGTYLQEARQKYGVPGASLAVLSSGHLHEVASGVLNTETQVDVTTDSVFQIGSITKLMTSVMVMQLVEEGKLDLDSPVRDVLANFSVADPHVSSSLTTRHLLTHSSGIDGDYFVDMGRGDDALERLLHSGRSLPQLHPLGAGFSYCNFGFAIAGRIIEVLDGNEWGVSLRRRIAQRLQADFLDTRLERLLLRRVAVGHIPGNQSGQLTPARRPFLPFAMGPAGTTPMCRARDLVEFARAFLNDGSPLLSASSVATMLTPQTPTVNAGLVQSFGIGFMLFDWNGVRIFGHDGATVAQNSYLRVHENGTIVSLLTNGGDVHGLAHDVMSTLFTEIQGVAPPFPREGTETSVEPSKYVGTFGRGLTNFTIESNGGHLQLSTGPGDEWSRGLTPTTGPFVLHPVDDTTFTYRVPGAVLPLSVKFVDANSTGQFAALHAGMRFNPRREQLSR